MSRFAGTTTRGSGAGGNFYPGVPPRRRSSRKWGKAARAARQARQEYLRGLRDQKDDRGGRRGLWRRLRRHEAIESGARADDRRQRRTRQESGRYQRREGHARHG